MACITQIIETNTRPWPELAVQVLNNKASLGKDDTTDHIHQENHGLFSMQNGGFTDTDI